ncbi:MAG TPA: TonB family protein [Myxococcota bacterium]|nr:TonB family protein [Myxococcota bacterium]
MTSIRLPASFALSLVATATLFWFLGLLIAVDPRGIVIPPVVPGINFTRHIIDTPVVTKPPIVRPPIEKPKPPPDVPTVVIDPAVVDPDTEREALVPVPDGTREGPFGPRGNGELAPGGTSGSDRGPVPQVRIPPDYPPQVRDRGIEGWVTFRFTVAVDGSVKDVAILDSSPPRIWDSATIRAVSNWKYEPAIKDGRPVEQRGVTVTYRYELER